MMFRNNGISVGDLFFTANNGFWAPGASNFTTSNNLTFNEHEQVYMAAQACGAYHLTLVMSQVRFMFNFRLIAKNRTSTIRLSVFVMYAFLVRPA